jgi:hypothetical protein
MDEINPTKGEEKKVISPLQNRKRPHSPLPSCDSSKMDSNALLSTLELFQVSPVLTRSQKKSLKSSSFVNSSSNSDSSCVNISQNKLTTKPDTYIDLKHNLKDSSQGSHISVQINESVVPHNSIVVKLPSIVGIPPQFELSDSVSTTSSNRRTYQNEVWSELSSELGETPLPLESVD